ncbi:MAG: hypothetical protein AB7T37_12105 [Dehalococcoidia bacterium]
MSWKLTAGLTALLCGLVLLARSVDGEDGTAMWDLSRAGGFTAHVLAWAAVFTGVGVDTRFHPGVVSQTVLYEAHRMLATLVPGFALVHAFALLLDPWVGFSVWDVFVPFAASYERWWTGLGVLALWGFLAVLASTWGAGLIPFKAWRWLHSGTYGVFVLGLLHGIMAGGDTEHWPTHLLYSATVGALLGAVFVRLVANRWIAESKKAAGYH